MFVTKEGQVLVNEIAPRPHNSGHQTIEANATSQYEQHLRAILGLPLGAPDLLFPSAMVNLLGEPDHSGPARYQGFEDVMAMPGVHVQ
jgi:5-(carboxyamino)imidazole ribonucleotide synthase